jgi:anhydro-N-acetylmuramic acid kinase
MREIYIGLMTGTSVDSIDCSLLDLSNKKIALLDMQSRAIPSELKTQILELSNSSNIDSELLKKLDSLVAEELIRSIKIIIKKNNLNGKDISAIGSHGQTIKHSPNITNPFSLQIGDPQLIADRLGITTVAQFRIDDIQSGGQGAPLTPIFHEKVFRDEIKKVIVNIGGITNITALDPVSKTIGFDTGPGNCLMDSWCRKNNKGNYDDKGEWASSGLVQEDLLELMYQDPYFKKNYPKSTGPDYFNIGWLENLFLSLKQEYLPEDIAATILQLTCKSLCNDIKKIGFDNNNIYLCGGGIHNDHLLKSIETEMGKRINTTESIGLDPDYLESICFGWFAKQRLDGISFDLGEITGSKGQVSLGRVWHPNLD